MMTSQPLKGLEGWFLARCLSIQDLSFGKGILKIAQKLKHRAAKMLYKHFLALILSKIGFYNFEVIFGHRGVKIGESVYFCMNIKKANVNHC